VCVEAVDGSSDWLHMAQDTVAATSAFDRRTGALAWKREDSRRPELRSRTRNADTPWPHTFVGVPELRCRASHGPERGLRLSRSDPNQTPFDRPYLAL
jgi:hypothetical protein